MGSLIQAVLPPLCTFCCFTLPDQIGAWLVCRGQQLPLCILSSDVFKKPTGRERQTSTAQPYVTTSHVRFSGCSSVMKWPSATQEGSSSCSSEG